MSIAQERQPETEMAPRGDRGAIENSRAAYGAPGTYFFSYHSALRAVNFCHFSGRSSRAKMAVTGPDC